MDDFMILRCAVVRLSCHRCVQMVRGQCSRRISEYLLASHFRMCFESSVASRSVLLNIRSSSLHDMLSNRISSGDTATAAAAAGSTSLLQFFFNNDFHRCLIVFECLARSRNRCRQIFGMISMISQKNPIHLGSRCRVMMALLA